jgi:hypothetical protein
MKKFKYFTDSLIDEAIKHNQKAILKMAQNFGLLDDNLKKTYDINFYAIGSRDLLNALTFSSPISTLKWEGTVLGDRYYILYDKFEKRPALIVDRKEESYYIAKAYSHQDQIREFIKPKIRINILSKIELDEMFETLYTKFRTYKQVR